MYRRLIAVIKLFIKSLFRAPSKVVEETTSIIEEIKEERQAEIQFNWNINLVKEFPDEPLPIYSSNLEYKEPIGYIVNGEFVNSIEPGAKVLKTIEEDKWLPLGRKSILDEYLEAGIDLRDSDAPSKPSTYILEPKKEEDVSKD